MSIIINGGAGGGGAAGTVMAPHTVDGDTVGHWEFDGDLTDDAGGAYDFNQGTHLGAPIEGVSGVTCLRATQDSAAVYNSVYSAALDNTTWTDYSMTLAACVWFDDLSISGDLARFEVESGGGTKWRWRCLSDGTTGISLDKVDGFSSVITTAAIPLQTWTWVAITMNADGKSGVTRVGDTEEAWAHTNPTDNGGTSQRLAVMSAWDTANGRGCMYSFIMKDIAASSAQLDAMQAQTGLV